MANPEHLKILKKGVETWNQWLKDNPKILPDLCGAYLKGMNLIGARLLDANLTEAKLSGVRFRGANLSGANLSGADLSGTDLSRTNFSSAYLKETSFRKANFSYTFFLFSILEKATFSDSTMAGATFANVDLSQTKGLDAVIHLAPSTIGIDTIYRSRGKIPEIFLRGAGVPENFITYMHSLAREAFDYYSCFISHSSKDHDFAKLLHAGLQQEGVRCWFAPEDLKTGDEFRQCIDEAIRIYDKLLVVLSENSIQSSWVKDEVEAALEKERRQNKLVLFPVRLDDAVMKTNLAWAASLRRTRHIGDFTKWKEHDNYQTAFQRLLRDLQGEAARGTSTGAP